MIKLIKLFVLVCFLMLNVFSFSQTQSCLKFKNGVFVIKGSIVGNTIITRYNDTQSEFLIGRKDTTYYYVEWLD